MATIASLARQRVNIPPGGIARNWDQRPQLTEVIDLRPSAPSAAEQRALATARARARSNEHKMQQMADRVAQLEGVLAYASQPQGPGMDAPDVFKGVGIGVDDGDLYHGGVIATKPGSIVGNATAGSSIELDFTSLARLRECRMWYMQVYAYTTGGNGAIGNLGQLAKVVISGQRNQSPITPIQNLPLPSVTTYEDSVFPLGARLGGYEITGTDDFNLKVEVIADLGLNATDTSGIYATIWAGGNRDPFG